MLDVVLIIRFRTPRALQHNIVIKTLEACEPAALPSPQTWGVALQWAGSELENTAPTNAHTNQPSKLPSFWHATRLRGSRRAEGTFTLRTSDTGTRIDLHSASRRALRYSLGANSCQQVRPVGRPFVRRRDPANHETRRTATAASTTFTKQRRRRRRRRRNNNTLSSQFELATANYSN